MVARSARGIVINRDAKSEADFSRLLVKSMAHKMIFRRSTFDVYTRQRIMEVDINQVAVCICVKIIMKTCKQYTSG